MNKAEAKEIIAEHIIRQTEFRLERFLFDKQRDFIFDPAPFKTAVCSRRSGKTVSCAAHLLDTAIRNPGVVCLYITLSRANAKRIVWPEIQRINRAYRLGGIEDNSDLSMRFPNDSVIYFSGAKDASEIEKFRGLALKLVYVDEAQSFRPFIEDLINEVLAPALMDYAGTLCMIGTPGPIPVGFFHEASVNSKVWSHHDWTFFDNPFITKKSGIAHRDLLNRELERRGVTTDDPSIQREWFGKWTLDTESLLIRYDAIKNHYDELPNYHWNYILGIDLGFDDADALSVIAWSESTPTTYLVEEVIADKQGITELVTSISTLTKKYKFNKMVIDQGGLGKKIAEEIRRRHHIPVQPADKMRKMENVAFLNDALRTERFKARKNSRFAEDSYLVEVDREKSTPDKIAIKSGFHSDAIDSCLYAFRESPAFSYKAPKIIHPRGSQAWAEEEEDEMWSAELEKAENDAAGNQTIQIW